MFRSVGQDGTGQDRDDAPRRLPTPPPRRALRTFRSSSDQPFLVLPEDRPDEPSGRPGPTVPAGRDDEAPVDPRTDGVGDTDGTDDGTDTDEPERR